MVILPVTGGLSGKPTDVFHTQQGHQGQHPQRLLGIVETILVLFHQNLRGGGHDWRGPIVPSIDHEFPS